VGNLGRRDLWAHALHCNSLAFTRRRRLIFRGVGEDPPPGWRAISGG
jgi:hypothetical protein